MQIVKNTKLAGGHIKERGKAGLALVAWMLGVPGFLVLLYLIFA